MTRSGWLALGLVLAFGPAAAQERPSLVVSDGRSQRLVSLGTSRGWLAIGLDDLTGLGWTVTQGSLGASLDGPGGAHVELRDGSPFFRWNGAPLQMVDGPYFEGGRLMIPLQFVSDILPSRLPDRYAFDGADRTLRVEGVERGRAPGVPEQNDSASPSEAMAAAPVAMSSVASRPAPAAVAGEPVRPPASVVPGVRRVIIDAGHGGADPGSISRSGVREKTVALGIALAVAKALDGHPGLEVRLLRDDDTFVPLWDRGAIATRLKGEAPGVFVSVHANSFTNSARGFETYFLSDARTEHERRVAAIENAPIALDDGSQPTGGDLDFILRDMKKLDTQHWSSLLAELVQEEVSKVHPGPNRGVKQAPLAVITNALMPSVLFEVGYLSHPEEARLLARSDFQEETGRAIADAVLRFFERYPPGSGSGAGEGR